MGERVILLSDAEARHLAATGTLFVVRPVTPQPPEGTHSLVWNANEGEDLPHLWLADNDYGEYPGGIDFDQHVRCPLGAPGDVLVGKEAWRVGAWNHEKRAIAVDYRADGFVRREWLPVENEALFERLWVESTDDAIAAGLQADHWDEFHWEPGQGPAHWRPASTMPARFVRHRPVVTEAGVMRVNEITDKQAVLAGWPGPENCCRLVLETSGPTASGNAAIQWFALTWNAKYGKKYGTFADAAPWAWWATVKREERNA